jgi:hypothetical protein
MNRIVARIIASALFIFCFRVSDAQVVKKTEDFRNYIPTENVDSRKEANTNRNKPKRKTILYIYKNDLKGILYGNPCAIEATREMGFEYVMNPFGVPGSMLPDEQFSNNIMVNLKLIVTRSPFWKIILNRKIKKCKEKSGDMVG